MEYIILSSEGMVLKVCKLYAGFYKGSGIWADPNLWYLSRPKLGHVEKEVSSGEWEGIGFPLSLFLPEAV